MQGSIQVTGIGPGNLESLTPEARLAIESADVILGYSTYLRQIETLAIGTPRESSGMRQEVSRANRAIDLAKSGKRVAVISGGDAGIYGMAGLIYEVLQERGDNNLEVEVIPGISALNAAAALLGAPLMTDFAVISLSDQMVALQQILRRLELAAQADFVICIYNPKGQKRTEPFFQACEILSNYRKPETPVGIVRQAYRPSQSMEIGALSSLAQAEVDMATILIIGNSQTFLFQGKMVTPRGYADKYQLADSQQ